MTFNGWIAEIAIDNGPINLVNKDMLRALNGVLIEVAARTERHWCPIKHARRALAAHEHYREFVDFGDADAYRKPVGDSSKPRAAGRS